TPDEDSNEANGKRNAEDEAKGHDDERIFEVHRLARGAEAEAHEESVQDRHCDAAQHHSQLNAVLVPCLRVGVLGSCGDVLDWRLRVRSPSTHDVPRRRSTTCVAFAEATNWTHS